MNNTKTTTKKHQKIKKKIKINLCFISRRHHRKPDDRKFRQNLEKRNIQRRSSSS